MTGLKQLDDEGAQLSSLTELCELLSISTEDTLAAFPVESVVPLLVRWVLGWADGRMRHSTYLACSCPASLGPGCQPLPAPFRCNC